MSIGLEGSAPDKNIRIHPLCFASRTFGITVARVEYEKLSGNRLGETPAAIRARVEKARERQRQRFAGTNLQVNADTGPAEVR